MSEDPKKELLVYQSKVKTACKPNRVQGGFVEALSEKVNELLVAAMQRAKDNGRVTLRPSDL